MYPVLFEAFGVTFHSYAVFVILAFTVAVSLGGMLAFKDGRDPLDILEGIFVIILGAVLGSKVFHTLFESKGHDLGDGKIAKGLFDLLAVDPWHWARLFEPGYVFYGGAVFGTFFGYLFVKRRGIDHVGKVFDNAAPAFALGIVIGRSGCILGGCCYGAPTDLAFAFHYPMSHPSHGVGVYPVQAFDITFGVVAMVLSLLLMKKRRFEGEIFAFVIAAYAIWRFTTEMFRGDGDRGVWFGGLLSTSQLVSLTILPFAVFIWLKAIKKARADESEKESAGESSEDSAQDAANEEPGDGEKSDGEQDERSGES
ncbi:MAG: prolipoprotein diacylglyceryl transferase [Deltaproteobacteria bacterium]|nr:prolipoprotein diacylglyceryl transferase [Deltaproteobacteria bacterium]